MLIDHEDGTYEWAPGDGYEPYDGEYRALVELVTEALCVPSCSEDERRCYLAALEELVGGDHAAYADMTGLICGLLEWVDTLRITSG